MTGLLRLAAGIDRLSAVFGWVATWLVLVSVLISAGNAASRYLFSLSSNAWLEIQWQMFSGIFLLGAAQVLKLNEHVRVDLLYGSASTRRKLWIDVVGIPLFLFPSTLVTGWFAWSFFLASYRGNEYSSNAGGLLLWPVKFLLPFGLMLLFLQGCAELVKRIAALRDHREASIAEYERPLQ
jgi:TRAP-type mannitol/chloroaromatic compound transport system permease small subunit